MPTPTTHFGWLMPDVGASTGVWGGLLNTDLQDIDTLLGGGSGALTCGSISTTGLASFSGGLDVNGGITVGSGGINVTSGTATFSGDVAVPIGDNSIIANAAGSFITLNGSNAFSAPGGGSLVVNGGGRPSFLFEFYQASNRIASIASSGDLVTAGSVVAQSGIVSAQHSTGQPACTLCLGDGTVKSEYYYNTTSGITGITHTASGQIFFLDNSGNFNVTNNAYKPGGGVWSTSSDERIKTVTGEYELGLKDVLQLRPVTYIYKGNDAPPDEASPRAKAASEQTPFVGFVAQELEQIFPAMVSRREGYIDGQKVMDLRDVDVSSLVYALVNCVKELKAEIEALRAAR